MNPKVEQWLKERAEEQKEQEQIAKDSLLIELGLYEEFNKQIEGNYDSPKCIKAIDVTDEEYEAILKYADTNKSNTNNGEEGLRTVAHVVLAICIICAILQIIIGLSYNGGVELIIMLLGACVTTISGLVIYWTTKVFTNISEKTTEIRDILKSRNNNK